MIDFSLNVAGSEWIIIIFVALVLILGTNKLPEAAKKLGRASAEYKKARDEVQNQMKDFSTQNVQVSGPVQNEREKLWRAGSVFIVDFELSLLTNAM